MKRFFNMSVECASYRYEVAYHCRPVSYSSAGVPGSECLGGVCSRTRVVCWWAIFR